MPPTRSLQRRTRVSIAATTTDRGAITLTDVLVAAVIVLVVIVIIIKWRQV